MGRLSGNFKLTPKRYQSGCGLSGILPQKGTNQKYRDKQLVSMNLIAIKIEAYISRAGERERERIIDLANLETDRSFHFFCKIKFVNSRVVELGNMMYNCYHFLLET